MRIKTRMPIVNSNGSALELRIAYGFDSPLSSWFFDITVTPINAKAFTALRLWSQIYPRLSNLEFLQFLNKLGFTFCPQTIDAIQSDLIPEAKDLQLILLPSLTPLTVSNLAKNLNAMFSSKLYEVLINNRTIELQYKRLLDLI